MLKHYLLFLLSLIGCAEIGALELTIDNILYVCYEGTGVCTALQTSAAIRGDVTIPDNVEVNGQTYKVTALGSYLFGRRDKVTSVTLPSTLVTIGDHAFYQCKISSIVIPEGVETIGESAFDQCSNLVSANLPSTLVTIGDEAFSMSGITSVALPASVQMLGDSAFYYCASLSSVEIGDGSSLTAIPNRAFYGCSSLTAFPALPPTVTSIGEEAFKMSGLVSAVIPGHVTDFGTHAFANCYSLKSITLPETMTAIPDYFLHTATALEKVNFPSGLKSIGVSAFRQCQKLTELNLPDGVETIGENAFAWCTAVKSLTLPTALKIVEKYAFYRLSGITELYIPDSVVEVKEGGFGMCARLRELRLSENLEKIGALAFSDICNGLFSELRIPPSVKEIGSKVFSNKIFSTCDIKHVRLWSEEPPLIADDTFQSYDIEVEVLNGTIGKYQTADVWQNFTNLHEELTSGAASISQDSAFADDDRVEAFTLTGQAVYSGAYGTMQLGRGVYIVRSNKTVKKITI